MRHIPEEGAAQNSLSWEAPLKGNVLCLLCSHAGTGCFAPFSVLLADLRATSAPCCRQVKPSPCTHTSHGFVCPVKALWWGRKAPWWSSTPLFISAGLRLSLGVQKARKLFPLGGNGTGFPPASPSLTQHSFPFQGHQIKPTKGKTCPLVLSAFTSLSYIQCPTPHTLTDIHFARSNHPKWGSGSYDHRNKHLSHLKLYLTLERDMLRT